MSLGRVTPLPGGEACPGRAVAAQDPKSVGPEGTLSAFASLLRRVERSDRPAHTAGAHPTSRISKEEIQLLLERKQVEMTLCVLRSLGAEGEVPGSDPDLLETVAAAEMREAAEKRASKNQQSVPKYDAAASSGELEPIIRQASETYGVDQDLIRAVIKAESNFRVLSTSPKGARGLMQLMPETAQEMGVKDSYDPFENIMGGTRYLRGLMDRYRGNIPRALAAYNWGPGNVERNPGRLPKETRDYIARVTDEYQSAKV